MKIEKLKLDDFKCMVNNEIEFRNLTIMTGTNASGKSSVIQALLLYSHALNHKQNGGLDVRESLGIDIGSPTNLISQNARGSDDYDFRIEIDGKGISFSLDKNTGLDLKIHKENAMGRLNICYLSAERMGPRMSYLAGGINKFKYDGSNAVYLMELAERKNLKLPKEITIDRSIEKFSHQAECWMSLIMGDMRLSTNLDIPKAQAELKIGNGYTNQSVIPTMTGFGIGYNFSIVIAGLWASTQSNITLIVENPEAHLHPSAQSAIGKFLAIVASCGVQVILETHSEHVVDGARIQSYCLKRSADMIVNYIKQQNEAAEIMKLTIEENGELSDWPEGFFDQKKLDLRQLFELRKKHADNK